MVGVQDQLEPSLSEEERGRKTRRDPLVTLLLVWVALLPIQFQLTAGAADRVAPADLVILVIPFVALRRLRVRPGTWSLAHTLLLALLPASLVYTLVVTGRVTEYAVVNKTIGLMLLFLAYVAMTTAIRTYGLATKAIRVFVISTTLVNIPSIIALILRWDQPIFNDLSHDLDRLTGMLVDPNAYGGLLVVALAFLIPGVRQGRRLLSTPFHYAAWISIPFGILLTESRSAWVALGVLFVALAITSPGVAARALFAIVFILVVIGIIAGADSRESFFARSDRPQTIDSRIQHIRDATDAYIEAPVFGIGLGEFYARHDQIVHVTAMWFLSDMGAIGLVVFLAFIGTMTVWGVRLAFHRRDGLRGDVTLGLLLAHLSMIGLSVGIEAMYQRHWWLVMALIATFYATERSSGSAGFLPAAGGPGSRSRFYSPPVRSEP
jgi:putative inorganic carbon (HCO3(-)) transporter